MRSMIVTLGVILVGQASNSNADVLTERTYSTEETRRLAHNYGQCVVRSHAMLASRAVLGNVDRLTLKKQYPLLLDRNCVDKQNQTLAFPGDFFAYILADALVARELTSAPTPDLSNVPPLERRSVAGFADLKRKFGYDAALAAASEGNVYQEFNDYGECVVRQNPADAKMLLMTNPESAAEVSAFAALQPALSACALQGTTMELTKLLVRGTVAFNYYRLAQSALHIPVH